MTAVSTAELSRSLATPPPAPRPRHQANTETVVSWNPFEINPLTTTPGVLRGGVLHTCDVYLECHRGLGFAC